MESIDRRFDEDRYAEMLELMFEQLIRKIALFFKYWAVDKLVVQGGKIETKLIKILCSGERCMAVRAKLFIAYITKTLGNVRYCFWDGLLYPYSQTNHTGGVVQGFCFVYKS